ncbi:hypothetical protein F5883DRAFT_46464 [Diaporthe sp. PMI_573]|nr:hypothetical protein F5883DRAFT_46464 [Diaporthaceae sp. PMI_573]
MPTGAPGAFRLQSPTPTPPPQPAASSQQPACRPKEASQSPKPKPVPSSPLPPIPSPKFLHRDNTKTSLCSVHVIHLTTSIADFWSRFPLSRRLDRVDTHVTRPTSYPVRGYLPRPQRSTRTRHSTAQHRNHGRALHSRAPEDPVQGEEHLQARRASPPSRGAAS